MKLNFKIDFAKVGKGILSVLQSNGGTIVGGCTMIGLALLCKKLNLPYEVLLDSNQYNPRQTYSNCGATESNNLVLIPSNMIESSISAILSSAKNTSSTYTKETAIKKIVSILEANKENLDERTLQYAIVALRSIGKSTYSTYVNDLVMNAITNIAKKEY